MPGAGGVVLDLGAQSLDVDVKGLGVAHVVDAPDAIDELGAGHDSSHIAQQHLEQLELLEGQLHRFARDAHLVTLDVHAHPGPLEDVGGLLGLRPATQHGADTGHEFTMAERLGDVVVSTELQPDDLVDLGVTRGDHDDAHRTALPQLTAHLGARDAGHHEVQQHDVGTVVVELGQAGSSVLGLGNLEPLLAEHEGGGLTVGLLVLDDEYSGHD